MILLYHDGTNAKIATSARLGREQHPPRHYQFEGHFLALDGPGHVIAHDAEEICKIPGYRLATPAEQDAYHASKRQASAIHETRSPDEAFAEGLEKLAESNDESTAPEQADAPQAAEHTTAPTRGKRSK